MGRNMFGPERGPWSEEPWRGWWGEDPPFHIPVFVLTHHAREPVEMQGGTTFYFVTDGIEPALERAFAAAGERDVLVPGGADTAQQYLTAGLVDELASTSCRCFSARARDCSTTSKAGRQATSARSSSPRREPRTTPTHDPTEPTAADGRRRRSAQRRRR